MIDVISEEIWGVLRDFFDDKVFSIDGFLVKFFKRNWYIVGFEVCMEIK